MKDLNRLLKEIPALHDGDFDPSGFEWIDFRDVEKSIVAFLRKRPGERPDPVLVVCNFTPVPRHNYRIGVPVSGFWRERLNSDAKEYGGSGQGNMGKVESVPVPFQGFEQSVSLTLPPLGILFLVPEEGPAERE